VEKTTGIKLVLQVAKTGVESKEATDAGKYDFTYSNVIFDTPQIYSVKDNTNIVKTRKVEYLDANYSYTLFLGKTEKTINYIIWYDEENYSENSFILTIKYKPNNVILSNQQHYESLLINNDTYWRCTTRHY
jgi:hypothetical protein